MTEQQTNTFDLITNKIKSILNSVDLQPINSRFHMLGVVNTHVAKMNTMMALGAPEVVGDMLVALTTDLMAMIVNVPVIVNEPEPDSLGPVN